MISSISSMSSSSAQKAPPPEQNVFTLTDSDSDGFVSSTELESLIADISEVTGNSMDVTDAMSTFDTDQDGSLNGEELQGLMSESGFTPPMMMSSEEGGESDMMPPPPPPDASQVVSAYGQNSGEEDNISQLIAMLQSDSDSTDIYSALEISA
ncbi:MAG: EF-hand domain-containing protein [Desulfuromonas sp.]|nr:EF-hand domain-containing protein [Desulfuromonas sp.]